MADFTANTHTQDQLILASSPSQSISLQEISSAICALVPFFSVVDVYSGNCIVIADVFGFAHKDKNRMYSALLESIANKAPKADASKLQKDFSLECLATAASRGEQEIEMELTLTDQSGYLRQCRLLLQYGYESSKPVYAMSIQDITEEKKLKAQAVKHEGIVNKSIGHLCEYVFLIDHKTTITEVCSRSSTDFASLPDIGDFAMIVNSAIAAAISSAQDISLPSIVRKLKSLKTPTPTVTSRLRGIGKEARFVFTFFDDSKSTILALCFLEETY
ncbi:MAG: hypothetical protein FWG10_09770 [Eubacteriaceae bacterium]|nr:hypothetical protein [Eubacteriaceae bacterium]